MRVCSVCRLGVVQCVCLWFVQTWSCLVRVSLVCPDVPFLSWCVCSLSRLHETLSAVCRLGVVCPDLSSAVDVCGVSRTGIVRRVCL